MLFLWEVFRAGLDGFGAICCKDAALRALCLYASSTVWRYLPVPACVSGKSFPGPSPREWATDPGCPLPGNKIAKTLTAFMVQLGHS